MRGNMGGLMAQAQRMQANLAKAQEEIKALEVEGTSGNGMVKVQLTGENVCRGITIDPSVIDPEDAEMLEDLVVLAFNDAKKQIEAISAQKMKAATAGMPLPGGMKFPF